ncbi:TSCPD domain-containing protein [Falsiroseomonas sp.]|uniref:TSCPD domain-containing protein n=1 Tax=Falsiroseomonas sp. TaxID=2870721 RepID=UPI00271DCB9B|nr:TSCPD domain-containing protein [Falsiroseomonas sp.]MDO9503659.1 TSCPD domain-containing protein [Falsiroseomonas sp.]
MTIRAGTLWDQVGLWRVRAAPDPDAAPRPIALPVAWDEQAAEALAALAPGSGPVVFPKLAEGWISRLALRGRELGVLADAAAQDGFAHALRALLLARRGAPGAAIWRGEARGGARFVLNLPAFLDAEGGFDAPGYAAAVALAVRALDIWTGAKAPRLCVGFADLAGLLASLGLRYGSAEARAVGAAIAALTRGAAEAESGRLAELLGAREPLALFAPPPPGATVVPGLAEAARAALHEAAASLGLRHQALVALAMPDAVEALLGAETGGLAPAPGATRLALDQHGWVAEVPSRAALRIGRAAAETLLAPVPDAEWRAMAQAAAPFLHLPPPMPVAEAAPARAAPPLPDRVATQPLRPSGSVWRVSVGGHKVVLRTAEDQQGRLSEVTIALTKESAAYRSLMDAMLQAVSIGLASGVKLDSFIEAYAYTRFGPAGAVEGDPAIRRATSVLDWAFRRLALDYLGRRDLGDPSEEDCAPDATGHAAEQLPLLPMDLPSAPSPRVRRRQLKLVG